MSVVTNQVLEQRQSTRHTINNTVLLKMSATNIVSNLLHLVAELIHKDFAYSICFNIFSSFITGKFVPDSAVLEMKANFSLPEEGFLFDEIVWIEFTREQAQQLVEM